MKHLLKHEYPELKKSEYKKACDFINGKFSQYYFLDYMRCSNGNVDDAIKFYYLDEEMRNLVFKNILRFEIQLKTDFANIITDTCHCSTFWEKKRFFMKDSISPRNNGKASKYFLLKKEIKKSLSHLCFKTMGPPQFVLMYTCSFGIFQELFKLIDRQYKEIFILKYTSTLKEQSYKILNTYFECIRKIRNRCAHGNHIISNKLLYELHNLKFGIREAQAKNDSVVFESVLNYIFNNSSQGYEFRQELAVLLKNNKNLLLKYLENILFQLN